VDSSKFISQEAEMYYLVNVDYNGMAAQLTGSDKGVKKCCISNAVDGTDDMLWNGSGENEDVRR
jgi:hypothetical protein